MTTEPPKYKHENEIHAVYMDMLNKGQFYVGQLGGHPISIEEWRDRELAKLREQDDN